MIFAGIDPGVSGAIVALDEHCRVAARHLMPTLKAGAGGRSIVDTREVIALVESLGIASSGSLLVALEEPQVRVGEGAFNSLSTGRNHGRIEGALVALGVRFDIVRPQAWRKALGISGAAADAKQLSIGWCRRFLPDLELLATPRCKKPHDGIADAACLAEYSRRVLAGVQGGASLTGPLAGAGLAT